MLHNHQMHDLTQRWLNSFNELQTLSNELGVGDPFNYNRGREIHTALTLGLTISPTLSGADAYYNGNPVELKSTIGSLKATYNGISVHPTWQEQEEYLVNKKLGKYKQHYICRYNGAMLEEVWMLSSDDVLAILLPKFHKQYHSNRNAKDPRLGQQINATEIKKFGTRVVLTR